MSSSILVIILSVEFIHSSGCGVVFVIDIIPMPCFLASRYIFMSVFSGGVMCSAWITICCFGSSLCASSTMMSRFSFSWL